MAKFFGPPMGLLPCYEGDKSKEIKERMCIYFFNSLKNCTFFSPLEIVGSTKNSKIIEII